MYIQMETIPSRNPYLSFLVKCHHYNSGTITFDDLCFLQKIFLSVFQADAVHDTFSLSALEPSLYHVKVGRVNTERDLVQKKIDNNRKYG